MLSVFLIAGYVRFHLRHVQVVSDYESVVNSAAVSIGQAVVAVVTCRTLAATMAELRGVPSAHITATFEGFHLVFNVDVRAVACHCSFPENNSCRSGCAAVPYNFAGEILGSWKFDRESRPV